MMINVDLYCIKMNKIIIFNHCNCAKFLPSLIRKLQKFVEISWLNIPRSLWNRAVLAQCICIAGSIN